MIYIIERASEYKNKPCEEAVKRPFKSTSNFEITYYWSVEINTLEELHQFIDKYGSVVIYNHYSVFINDKNVYYNNTPYILIYDSYIE